MQGVRWLVRLTHHFSSLGAPNSDSSLQPKSNCGETHLIQAFEIQNVAPWDGGAGGTKKDHSFGTVASRPVVTGVVGINRLISSAISMSSRRCAASRVREWRSLPVLCTPGNGR